MKPPICIICGKRFDNSDEGGLIYFKETEKDKEWKKRVEEKGLIGHPPYAEWFCGTHYQEASKLKEKSKDGALKILKNKF